LNEEIKLKLTLVIALPIHAISRLEFNLFPKVVELALGAVRVSLGGTEGLHLAGRLGRADVSV
jgi:hypothetical protein